MKELVEHGTSQPHGLGLDPWRKRGNRSRSGSEINALNNKKNTPVAKGPETIPALIGLFSQKSWDIE